MAAAGTAGLAAAGAAGVVAARSTAAERGTVQPRSAANGTTARGRHSLLTRQRQRLTGPTATPAPALPLRRRARANLQPNRRRRAASLSAPVAIPAPVRPPSSSLHLGRPPDPDMLPGKACAPTAPPQGHHRHEPRPQRSPPHPTGSSGSGAGRHVSNHPPSAKLIVLQKFSYKTGMKNTSDTPQAATT